MSQLHLRQIKRSSTGFSPPLESSAYRHAKRCPMNMSCVYEAPNAGRRGPAARRTATTATTTSDRTTSRRTATPQLRPIGEPRKALRAANTRAGAERTEAHERAIAERASADCQSVTPNPEKATAAIPRTAFQTVLSLFVSLMVRGL